MPVVGGQKSWKFADVLNGWSNCEFKTFLKKERELSFLMKVFQVLNDKIYNYVKQNIIVNFIIQKLKNKHTFPKKSKNWGKLSSLNFTEREETKSKYFAPMLLWSFSRLEVRDNQDMDKGPSFPFSVLWAVCISIEVPQSDSYLGQFLPPKPAKNRKFWKYFLCMGRSISYQDSLLDFKVVYMSTSF